MAKKRQQDIKGRHSVRQKRRKRAMRIRRTIFFLILLIAAILALMFLTPIFNIQKVAISGNERVTAEEITEKSGIVIGENLFKVNLKQSRESLSGIPYLDKIHLKRVLYPPSVKVTVTEGTISAYAAAGGGFVGLDRNCKVLETLTEPPGGVPEITGLGTDTYTLGKKLEIDESDKFDIILLCIDEFEKKGYLEKINRISVEDTSDILFRYEDRLDILCGSALDLGRKLRLFEEVLHDNRLTDNSRGTIDLSITGKAVYTP